jgi:hypothetical protein
VPSSPPPVDQETFQAWKASQVTQWVLRTLKAQAAETAVSQQDQIWGSLPQEPAEWTKLQPRMSFQAGRCNGVMHVVELDYTDLLDADQLEAFQAAEKAKSE